MKKSYLMIAAVAALFAACSNNDTFKEVDTQDAVIGFGYSGTEKNTRAELTMPWFRTLDNAFGVYGYKDDNNQIFKNEEVKCSDDQTPYEWTHTTVRFWDKGAEDAYDFYAYAPFDGTNNSTTNANPTFDKTNGFTFTALPLIAEITDNGKEDKAIANAVENIDYVDDRLHDTHANSPTVPFIFNHILSKLSFKIKTDIENTTAVFTVKSIKIDFPSDNNVTWAEGGHDVTGETTYSNSYAEKTGSKLAAAFETTVFTGEEVVPYSTAASGALALGKSYIVTPVNGTIKKHEFDVEVTYDIEYSDGTSETGCIATGTIGTGNPDATVNVPGSATYDANIYAPAQNSYYIAVINLKPEQIEFCVEDIEEWDPNGEEVGPVDVD